MKKKPHEAPPTQGSKILSLSAIIITPEKNEKKRMSERMRESQKTDSARVCETLRAKK